MKQYVPLKPVKMGFKTWLRAEAENGNVSAFDGLEVRVVKELSSDLHPLTAIYTLITFSLVWTSYWIYGVQVCTVVEPCAQIVMDFVEEACPAGLHHSGFSCGNHQPKIFFEIPNVMAACCCLHQW